MIRPFRFARSLLIATAGVAALVASASAQDAPGKFVFGVYGGMNYTTAEGSGISNPAYRTGMVVAGFMVWKLSDVLSLQPEVQFSQEGTKMSGTKAGVAYKSDMSVEYIQFPVLVRFQPIHSTGPLSWHLLAGPHMAVRIGCGVSSSPGWLGAPTACHEFGEPQSVDWGGMVGAGADFKLGDRSLTLSTRYHIGVPEMFSGTTAKNRGLSFVVGTSW